MFKRSTDKVPVTIKRHEVSIRSLLGTDLSVAATPIMPRLEALLSGEQADQGRLPADHPLLPGAAYWIGPHYDIDSFGKFPGLGFWRVVIHGDPSSEEITAKATVQAARLSAMRGHQEGPDNRTAVAQLVRSSNHGATLTPLEDPVLEAQVVAVFEHYGTPEAAALPAAPAVTAHAIGVVMVRRAA